VVIVVGVDEPEVDFAFDADLGFDDDDGDLVLDPGIDDFGLVDDTEPFDAVERRLCDSWKVG